MSVAASLDCWLVAANARRVRVDWLIAKACNPAMKLALIPALLAVVALALLPACATHLPPHTTVAQNLAQQTVQAEAVAAQNGATPQRAQNYANTLAQAFGERGDVGALANAAQQLAAQRPADAAAIAAAASVFVPPAVAFRRW